MAIRSLRRSDIQSVATLSWTHYNYYTDPSFPATFESTRKMIQNFCGKLPYLKVMVIDEKIVGWFAAQAGSPFHHSYKTAYTQLYYHTSLKGIKAVRALIEFHNDYFKHVEKMGYDIALTSSYLPSENTFIRTLEKNNWNYYNGRLSRRTHWYERERTPVR
jgi:hypothetical protein